MIAVAARAALQGDPAETGHWPTTSHGDAKETPEILHNNMSGIVVVTARCSCAKRRRDWALFLALPQPSVARHPRDVAGQRGP
jgi:hypothetical protein